MLDRALQLSILQCACQNSKKGRSILDIANKDLKLDLTESEITNILAIDEIKENHSKSILYISILYYIQDIKNFDFSKVFIDFTILKDIIWHKLDQIGVNEIEEIIISKNFGIDQKPKEETKKSETPKETKKEEEFEDIFI